MYSVTWVQQNIHNSGLMRTSLKKHKIYVAPVTFIGKFIELNTSQITYSAEAQLTGWNGMTTCASPLRYYHNYYLAWCNKITLTIWLHSVQTSWKTKMNWILDSCISGFPDIRSCRVTNEVITPRITIIRRHRHGTLVLSWAELHISSLYSNSAGAPWWLRAVCFRSADIIRVVFSEQVLRRPCSVSPLKVTNLSHNNTAVLFKVMPWRGKAIKTISISGVFFIFSHPAMRMVTHDIRVHSTAGFECGTSSLDLICQPAWMKTCTWLTFSMDSIFSCSGGMASTQ